MTTRHCMCTCLLTVVAAAAARATEAPRPPLLPVDEKAIAERMETLRQEAPKGARLAAYLDCGSQAATGEGSPLGLKLLRGEAYRFPVEQAEVPPAAPTIFFDAEGVVFEVSGVERTGRYVAGLTWWDYDAGGRSQTVLVGSADRRNMRIAIAAVGLPDFKVSKKLPAQKQFALPATFARDGKLEISVIQAAGPNAVVSELWVWQLGP
ncbi:MAG: hypothetical protein ACYC6Y_06790 [Thermoguttaceae bacterium]